MEVGKLILNVANAKANMTLSVKPFGCMPSSGVSDGVQSLITEKYPQAHLLPDRDQRRRRGERLLARADVLFKARLAAKAEYKAELEKTGLTVDELRAYLQKKHWRGSSLFYPRHGTVASTAANLVQHVVEDIKKTRTAKVIDFTKRMHRARGRPRPRDASRAQSAPRAAASAN